MLRARPPAKATSAARIQRPSARDDSPAYGSAAQGREVPSSPPPPVQALPGLPIYLSTYPSIHPSIHPSTHPLYIYI